ncbi:pre-tRNA nuclear export protein [Chytridiales sp. JEL 0842]|nr:pre-tRNA nuclear export protein [Chytridiales sp. JEL 0842]
MSSRSEQAGLLFEAAPMGAAEFDMQGSYANNASQQPSSAFNQPQQPSGTMPPPTTQGNASQQSIFQQSSHPTVLFFHLFFRSLALLTYIFGWIFTDSFVFTFVLIVLLLAFDFWTVKNVTGRLLVGLRWWNEIKEDGSNVWIFESRENRPVNAVDSRVFWVSLYAAPAIWVLFGIGAIFKLSVGWGLVVVVALVLNMANVIGYTRCEKDARARLTNFVASQGFVQGMPMENLERAILVALDPTANPELKAEATAYYEQIRADPQGWKLCLSLFLASPKRVPEARFIALQALEEVLRTRYNTLDASERIAIRQSLWSWLQNDVDSSDPAYIRNKFCQVLVLLFKYQYADGSSWPTFFDDITALVASSSSTPRSEITLYMFLRICLAIDEEIISKDGTRTESDIAVANTIKDQMREGSVVKLRDLWFQILMTSYRTGAVDPANMCLRIIGVYVLWIEIKLVVVPEFISTLYDCLQIPGLRVAAVQCLMGIVDKGMGDAQKLDLITVIRASDLPAMVFGDLDKETNIADDEEFFEQVAKFINDLGVEICLCWDHTPAYDVRGACLVHLQKILPYAIKYLENDYDDIACLVFPFVDEYIKLLKDTQKQGNIIKGIASVAELRMYEADITKFVEESFVILLRAVIKKMKYDEEVPHEFGEANEDDALFQQLRRTLRGKMELLGEINSDLFLNYFSSVITSSLEKLIAANQAGKPLLSAITWSEAELALYLLYIFRGPIVFGTPESPSTLSLMLEKMMISDVVSFPHPSIPLMFFENVFRYGQFFAFNPKYIPVVLEAFCDNRGLHHPSLAVRSRAFYLFLKFVKDNKDLKDKLQPIASKVILAIQDVLEVKRPSLNTLQMSGSVDDLKAELKATMFDSQLYVFETVGYLISLEHGDVVKQEELLRVILSPLMSSIRGILENELYKINESTEGLVILTHLKQLITAVGSVGKGFPDYDVSSKAYVSSPLWASVFKQALQLIIVVLEQLNTHEIIRDAARFAFQRLVGCIGDDILPFVQPLITAGLFNATTAKELNSFLPSISQLMHKFKKFMIPILNDSLGTIMERIFYYQNQPATGYDDRMEVADLRRSYLTFLNTVFINELEDIFISDGLSNSPNAGMVGAKALTNADKGRKEGPLGVGGKSPLPGFDKIIYQNIVRTLFEIPLKPEFNAADGQSLVVFAEMASLHKTILSVQGLEYIEYLQTFLPSIQCPPEVVLQFTSALQQLPTKQFQGVLRVCIV